MQLAAGATLLKENCQETQSSRFDFQLYLLLTPLENSYSSLTGKAQAKFSY